MKLENYTGSPITQWILLGSPFSSDTKKTHEVFFLVFKKKGGLHKISLSRLSPFFSYFRCLLHWFTKLPPLDTECNMTPINNPLDIAVPQIFENKQFAI